ncbi:MAG TPA: BLUF domain-containing protein [Wenzhouxiangellaceae bacterium]|nr:BLUF domain-containing protein [Wenzhouxiangellaceae bacterium]
MTAGIEGSSDDMTVFEDYAPDALVRAAFCSEANFSSWADPRGVELEISRIMYPAPRLQADELAGGIFHYGNRFFLQCLEGPREAIEAIYRRNSDDVRHKNTELLVVEPIERRMFPENTMSYVSMRRQLLQLLGRHGVGEFNPFRITPAMLGEFLQMYAETHR